MQLIHTTGMSNNYTNTKRMQSNPVINVTNYVASAEISGFDIDTILRKNPGAKYRPNGFPGTVIITRNSSSIINLYDSGKIASIKSNTKERATRSLCDFVKELNNTGMRCKIIAGPQIVMISAIVEYYGMINIDALRGTIHYIKDIRYFPAIQLSFPDGVAVKAYAKKLVITARSMKHMIRAIKDIQRYVRYHDDGDAFDDNDIS